MSEISQNNYSEKFNSKYLQYNYEKCMKYIYIYDNLSPFIIINK